MKPLIMISQTSGAASSGSRGEVGGWLKMRVMATIWAPPPFPPGIAESGVRSTDALLRKAAL